MNKPKVFLTGGDGMGWALDEDLSLTRRALEGIVEFTDLEHCEVVHSVWWEGLLRLPKEQLIGKRIICHVPGEPFRYLTLPHHRHAVSLVGCWVTQTSQAAQQLTGIGVPNQLIPYTVDVETFQPLYSEDAQLEALRRQWQFPPDAYLVGSFQRDTEGYDLSKPKLMKGPDIFLEILSRLWQRGYPIHAVLAGPRRHWLRRQLTERGIPVTYVGQPVETDDIEANLLPRRTLNLLYNLVDLYVVASRSEGGPHSIMEAAAARCKIISTPVGLASDILDTACVFTSPADAVALIEQDIAENKLAGSLDLHYERVHRRYRPDAVAPLFRRLYEDIDKIPIYKSNGEATYQSDARRKWMAIRFLRRFFPRAGNTRLTVGLWHTFFSPPYGGGNQFMLALRKALRKRGVRVRENEIGKGIDAYLLNSIHFDVDRFLEFSRRHRLNIVHRIDGPIHLIRGFDREKDELGFRLNTRFASATVLQSAWTYQRIVEMGYQPVNPVVIHNAVDPDIFHRRGRISFDPERKIRLVSTSWSDNPRKGGPIYKWIEAHLDWDRFEYTFVGRASERFDRIRQIPPLSSEQLANILRQHDIYITASQNDPCSNALIEALSCGLPALYLNDGGHPELVGYGGLPFNDVDGILPQLDALVENYKMFQNLIVVPSLDDVAEKYLTLLRDVAR